MIMRRRTAMFVPVCLVGGGLLVSAALFTVLSSMPGSPRRAPGSVVVQEVLPPGEAPIDAGFSMPPAETFVEIVMRPIFAPNRQPAPEQNPPIETIASQLDLRLIGVIVSSGTPIAIVAARGSDIFTRVTVGDHVQGWTVEQIEPRRVTLRRGEAIERIELSYDLPSALPRPTKTQAGDDKAKEK